MDQCVLSDLGVLYYRVEQDCFSNNQDTTEALTTLPNTDTLY